MDYIIRFSLYFIPVAIITGPALSDIAVSIAGLAFIFKTFKKKMYYYFTHPLCIFFWVWCFYLVLNSLISENKLLSLESSLFYFRFGVFSLAILYAIENYSNFIKNFTKIFLTIYVIVIIDAYIQYIFGKNILGYEHSSGRLSGFFGDEHVLGSYISRLLPLYFALLFINYRNSILATLFGMITLISVDILIYLSGERSAFFYLILSTIAIIVLIKKWRLLRLVTLSISILIIVLISFTNQKIKFRMIDRTLEEMNISGFFSTTDSEISSNVIIDNNNDTKSKNLNIFSVQHQAFYESAFKMFKDNKLIGVGPKMFREFCKKPQYNIIPEKDISQDGCSTHPHNTYLQLLSETGLIGTFPVILCFLYIIFSTIKQGLFSILNKEVPFSDVQICLLLCLLITLWPLVPTGNFFSNWLSVIYYLPVGFLLSKLKEENSIDNKA